MTEKEEIIIYNQDNFDPTRMRKTLGLEQENVGDIESQERLRLANILRRAGHLSDEEVGKLGMVIRKVDSEKNE